MKHQIKRLFLVSACLLLSATANANNSCQWSHLGAMSQDIKIARTLLTNYGACKSNCQGLEIDLNNSVSKMSTASACSPHITTAANREMIDFVTSRFRLIKHQKTVYNWGSIASSSGQTQRTVATMPTTPVPTPVVIPTPSQFANQQTTMAISDEAFSALWLEDGPSTGTQQDQLAQQRHAHLRKQVILQQRQSQQAAAKKRRLRIQQQHQQVQRKMVQLQQRRARVVRLNQQRIKQQQMARARQN